MPIQSQTQLESDLDFIVDQNGVTLTGVTPSGIAGIEFKGLLSDFNEGHQEQLSGSAGVQQRQELEATFLINATNYSVLPKKGAVLRDSTNSKKFKVWVTSKDNLSPTSYRMSMISQFSNG